MNSDFIGMLRDKSLLDAEGDGLVSFLNPYSYVVARRSPNRDVYGKLDRIYFDGIALSLAMRIHGVKRPRTSFDMTSCARQVFSDAAVKGVTVCFVGGMDGVAATAAEIIKGEFFGLLVTGIYGGYFSSTQKRADTIAEIVSAKPAVVIVGMGAPLQEVFLVDLWAAGWRGRGYTCGGFLHQTASSGIKYYPQWMDRFHLRWLFRLLDEPKLIKRMIVYYPTFVALFFVDSLRYISKRLWGRAYR
jgi:N-acetylglucosaminyldiphosphoundecaprenol N-acetyl-beta-D-mannosaminyltransferase